MSRPYEMHIRITDFNLLKQEYIDEACDVEAGFPTLALGLPNEQGEPMRLEAGVCVNLCAGETEQEFAARLSHAVWEANEGPCTVQIRATCLESIPFETYEYGTEQYKEYQEVRARLEQASGKQ